MKNYKALSFRNVDITGGFWAERQKINRETTIFSLRERFKETFRFEAFKFNYSDSCGYRVHIFWDSDVAKWIESVAYIIEKDPGSEKSRELTENAEELISLILKNQEESGYFNTYFQQVEPENRFIRRDAHELYCAGHLMEAAVAYYYATGKDAFLRAMCRYADYIEKCFVTEKSTEFMTPGHEEIELALVKLYEATNEKRYLELSRHFIDERGNNPEEAQLADWCNPMYNQSHKPVREQRTAEGHSVRACYLYSGMADIARKYNDKELMNACDAIFDNIVSSRMYITGGIGSSREGEAFTVDYDLPNSRAYTETCAAIALAYFAGRMLLLKPDAKYADIVEKVIYNGFLSGVSLDGKSFFYENPLEINLRERNRNVSISREPEHFPITQRKEHFDCSCCPPNVTRFIASIADFIHSYSDSEIYIHQYMNSEAAFDIGGNAVKIKQTTLYPVEPHISFEICGAKGKTVYLRIPGWCKRYSLAGVKSHETDSRYLKIEIDDDFCTFELEFDLDIVFVSCNPLVSANVGKLALMRGPVVYCLESVENTDNLNAYFVDYEKPDFELKTDNPEMPMILADGFKLSSKKYDSLYMQGTVKMNKQRFCYKPYYQFANIRTASMLVWVKYISER